MNMKRFITISIASLLFQSYVFAAGFYDAEFQDGTLDIPFISADGTHYQVSLVFDTSDLAQSIGCTSNCFRLSEAKEVKDISSSSYANYDPSTNVVRVDNLWFQNSAYDVSLKVKGSFDGQLFFEIDSAEKKTGIPVYDTSYENKHHILLDDPYGPSFYDNISDYENFSTPDEQADGVMGFTSLGFADFTQTGKQTALILGNRSINRFPDSNPGEEDSPAKIYFFNLNREEMIWTDITSTLIQNNANRYLEEWCVYGPKIADFNNDSKPDVYFNCTGIDYPLNGSWNTEWHWGYQYILLSQPDGFYKTIQLPIGLVYGHGAALADFDNDGNIDVISTSETPFVLWGNGDGTFVEDTDAFPAELYGKSLYMLFAIPIDGKIKVVASGFANIAGGEPANPADYGTQILEFRDNKFVVTEDITPKLPEVQGTDLEQAMTLDIVFLDGYYYLFMSSYKEEALIRVNSLDNTSEILAKNFLGNKGRGSGVLKLTSDRKLVMYMPSCMPDAPPDEWFYEGCNWSYPIP